MFADFRANLRYHVLPSLVAALIGAVLVGAMVAMPRGDTYESSATVQLKLIDETPTQNPDAGAVASKDDSRALQLIASAQVLFESPQVLAAAGSSVSPAVSAAVLSKDFKYDTRAHSLIQTVRYTSKDRERADGIMKGLLAAYQKALREHPLKDAETGLALVFDSQQLVTQVSVDRSIGIFKIVLAAVLGGIAVGVGYLAVRALTDNRVRSTDHIALLTDDSVVGFVDEPPTDDQIGNLSHRLKYLVPPGDSGRIIGVTSLTTGDISAALVQKLANRLESQYSVCMLDSDMRARPLGTEGAGLSDYLSGASLQTLSEATRVLAGDIPPNPLELLERQEFDDVLSTLRSSHEWTVVNCPPILPVSDTAQIASRLDALLIVVRGGVDRRSELLEALAVAEAGNAMIAGLILTKAKERSTKDPYAVGSAVKS